jgi:prevent-host-death family protein
MRKVSVAEARQKLRLLLDEVESGKQVALLRRGREVARIVPAPAEKRRRLPPLKAFRSSIAAAGEPLSRTVIRGRRSERY